METAQKTAQKSDQIEATADASGTPKNVPTVKAVTDVIVNAVNLHHLGPESLQESTSLRDGGLGLDSIDILEVVVALEQHFGVKINDPEAAKKHFRTIGGIAEYIQILQSA